MILTTERLILRPWQESDAANLYYYAKDPAIGPSAGWPPHGSEAESLDVIRYILSAPETYAICRKEDNIAVGSIGLMTGGSSNLGLPDNEGEIGYWIGKPFWGRGLVPEAVRALITHAFDDLKLQALWCGYFEGNDQSKRVQEKCGFVYHHSNPQVYWQAIQRTLTEHVTVLTAEARSKGFTVRLCTEKEQQAALDLTWEVFLQFIAPACAPEAVENFRRKLNSKEQTAGFRYYGAFRGDRMIGTLQMREPRHLVAFFVKKDAQGKGVGRSLFDAMLKDYGSENITVNASDYALPIYRHFGFIQTEKARELDGITATPMVLNPTSD